MSSHRNLVFFILETIIKYTYTNVTIFFIKSHFKTFKLRTILGSLATGIPSLT
jgi:hypothetical protein